MGELVRSDMDSPLPPTSQPIFVETAMIIKGLLSPCVCCMTRLDLDSCRWISKIGGYSNFSTICIIINQNHDPHPQQHHHALINRAPYEAKEASNF